MNHPNKYNKPIKKQAKRLQKFGHSKREALHLAEMYFLVKKFERWLKTNK